MAHPQVAVGGSGLQIWKLAVNKLNKLSRIAEEGWSCSLEVEASISSSQRNISTGNVKQGLRLGRILWINDLS
jgi:hypothetical protein